MRIKKNVNGNGGQARDFLWNNFLLPTLCNRHDFFAQKMFFFRNKSLFKFFSLVFFGFFKTYFHFVYILLSAT